MDYSLGKLMLLILSITPTGSHLTGQVGNSIYCGIIDKAVLFASLEKPSKFTRSAISWKGVLTLAKV